MVPLKHEHGTAFFISERSLRPDAHRIDRFYLTASQMLAKPSVFSKNLGAGVAGPGFLGR
jgi:hypothetical protein